MKRKQMHARRSRYEIDRDRVALDTRLYELLTEELFTELRERPLNTIALRWGARLQPSPKHGYALCELGRWCELPHVDLFEGAAPTFLFVTESGAILCNNWDSWPCRTAHPKYEKTKPLLKSWERDFLTKTADVEVWSTEDRNHASSFAHFPRAGTHEEKQFWREGLWSAVHFARPDSGLQAYRVKYDKGVFHLYVGPLIRCTRCVQRYWGVENGVCIPDHPEIKFLRRRLHTRYRRAESTEP